MAFTDGSLPQRQTQPARLYVSNAILTEYRDVLSRPELRIRKGLQQQLLDLIRKRAHLVRAVRTMQASTDLGDNIIVESADAARADYLGTGNAALPKILENTKVITSSEFVSVVAPHLVG